MPMFQHYQKDGLVGFDGGGDGHVLDLDTAVKDGVLGGGGGGVVGGIAEKLDLKRMIEELDLSEIPSVFICPISLEPMQDPVTLCTGQTYERSNILKWFSLGHLTCPTTMQELWDDSVTPNKTLYHLIYSWFSQKYLLMKKRSEDKDFRSEIVSSHSLLVGLMRLVKDKRHPNGNLPGLTLLRTICLHKQVRNLFVSIGAIPQLVELLPALNPDCLESALFILDTLSSLPEGRLALRDCLNTIPNMVRLLMRVSESCTQYALAILWSVCKLAPEECSSIAVEAGLAAKLLLVIQSGCNPVLKQRSAELLKLCSLNYTDTTFISKCKLTKTIQ
ncbi:unnamed protein product, partial [Vitis vinifera]